MESPQNVRMVARDSDALPIYAVFVLQTNDGSEPALAKIKKTASLVSGYITNDMEQGTPSIAAVIAASDDVNVDSGFHRESRHFG